MNTSPAGAPGGISNALQVKSEAEKQLFREHLANRLPLVIGVTGHRTIAPSARLQIEAEVRNVLRKLRAQLPNTPFIVLSALADGADRLVAQIATGPEFGARLVAPLPLSQSLYERDFNPESLKEFRLLLQTPLSASFELPLMPGISPAEASRDGTPRNAQFALSGAYIALRSHVLLALWDGRSSDKLGGTSETVRFKLEGVPALYRSALRLHSNSRAEDLLELGPVYQVLTPRSDSTTEETPAVTLQERIPKSYEYQTTAEAQTYYRESLLLPVERFNSEDRESSKTPQSKLISESGAEYVNSDELPESLLYLDRLFARADGLAIYYGRKTRQTLLGLSLFVFLAALCFDLSHEFMNDHELLWLKPIVMLLFPGLMLSAFLLDWNANRRHFQDRFQDYRALAEGLRVQFFWQLAGSDESVGDYYLGKQRSELSWIRRACAAARIFPPASSGKLSAEAVETVRKCWIDNQRKYFSRQSERESRKLERLELAQRLVFWSGLLSITLVAVLGFPIALPEFLHFLRPVGEHHSLTHAFMVLFAVMSAVVTALLHNYIDKSAIRYHSKQYHRMARMFRAALLHVTSHLNNRSFAPAQAEIHSLGVEALGENADWVMTHRERPVEVPHH